VLALGAGAGHAQGDAGNDTLLAEVASDVAGLNLNGGGGNDSLALEGSATDGFPVWYGYRNLYGDDGDDTLEGSAGGERLWGGAGHDDLAGNDGDDELFGGDDNDTLDGGGGQDWMQGDAGADAFRFGVAGAGPDTVADFQQGEDFIVVSAANFEGLAAGMDLAVQGRFTANAEAYPMHPSESVSSCSTRQLARCSGTKMARAKRRVSRSRY
jgi:Ca2+-binding RTX toxin-like protein